MDGTDEERFARLFREQFGPVARYLLARADRDLAYDALARTFEVAWRRLADVPADPLGWLDGVARRVLSELRRAQGRREAIVERLLGQEARDAQVADVAELSIQRMAALRALKSLSPGDREILLLVAWDGLSEKQAAAVLDCSRGAFALRLHRARARLDALLQTGPQDQRHRRNRIRVQAAHPLLRTAATTEEAP
ncbi:MAG: RNA polymerase sigma factor [Acidimicrobiales bacterium]